MSREPVFSTRGVRVFVDDTGNGAGAIDPYGLAFHGGRFFVGSFFFDHVMEFDATTTTAPLRIASSGRAASRSSTVPW